MKAIKVADEVWIATALLHRENPKREDFTVAEIVERVRREHMAGELRPSVQVHAYLHCVANRPPNPGRHRMLYATGKNTRRLFRETDDFDPVNVLTGLKTVGSIVNLVLFGAFAPVALALETTSDASATNATNPAVPSRLRGAVLDVIWPPPQVRPLRSGPRNRQGCS